MLTTDVIIGTRTVNVTMAGDFFRQHLEAIRCVSRVIYQQITPVMSSFAFILTIRRWERENFLYCTTSSIN